MVQIDPTLSDNNRLKKRGNEEQHQHNNKVMVKFREGLYTENLDSAKEKISAGMELIKNRQKLIKIADSSEVGWRVVAEYTSNPLADDSDDEKRIYKAQVRADSKIKKEKAKRKLPPTRPTSYNIPVTAITNINRPGKGYSCNETGHWRRECPILSRDGLSQNKIRNNIFFCNNNVSCTSIDINIQDKNNVLKRSLIYDINNKVNSMANNKIDMFTLVNIESPSG